MSVDLLLQLDSSARDEFDRLSSKLDEEELKIATSYLANLLLSRVQPNGGSQSRNSR